MSKCECESCKYRYRNVRLWSNSNSDYFCKHPNTEYISNYWKENKIKKMEGHLYYGYSFARKTTPKWCPKKEERKEE